MTVAERPDAKLSIHVANSDAAAAACARNAMLLKPDPNQTTETKGRTPRSCLNRKETRRDDALTLDVRDA